MPRRASSSLCVGSRVVPLSQGIYQKRLRWCERCSGKPWSWLSCSDTDTSTAWSTTSARGPQRYRLEHKSPLSADRRSRDSPRRCCSVSAVTACGWRSRLPGRCRSLSPGRPPYQTQETRWPERASNTHVQSTPRDGRSKLHSFSFSHTSWSCLKFQKDDKITSVKADFVDDDDDDDDDDDWSCLNTDDDD